MSPTAVYEDCHLTPENPPRDPSARSPTSLARTELLLDVMAADASDRIATVTSAIEAAAEMAFIAWLLVKGVRTPRPDTADPPPPSMSAERV